MAKKILIIDDDYLVLKTIDKYLKSYGYNIETAQSGMQALEKVKKDIFDLIISDVRMPGMDGVETLKRIKELTTSRTKKRIPVIVITGYVGKDDIYENAEELGVVKCIYKPFDSEEFIETVKKNLDFTPVYQKEISIDYKPLNESFLSLVANFREYLKKTKEKFDNFDKLHSEKMQRIHFLELQKEEIVSDLAKYFKNIWNTAKSLGTNEYNSYAHYLREKANDLFIHSGRINDYIFKKPLGYPGDFVMMNYIFDYYKDTYLGDSSYEMFLNHLACNVPISRSNIKRKDYFKKKLIEVIDSKKGAKILSVGSGSSRELIELLKEGRIKNNFYFHCLDFEEKALQYVEKELSEIDPDKKKYCEIEYTKKNLLNLVKDRKSTGLHKEYDFIYCSGVFDYLKDRVATRLVNILFNHLVKNGTLIFCAANNKDGFYRVSYEMMGDWVFNHREKEELIKWLQDIKDKAKVNFEDISDKTNYSFLNIKKLS